jgi:ABC-type glycerol-3-phosphate transport system substrate-binding protein
MHAAILITIAMSAVILATGSGALAASSATSASQLRSAAATVKLCGTTADVTIKWQNWISVEAASAPFATAAVKAFEKQCPNVTIEIVGISAENTGQQLALDATAKSGADVFQTEMGETTEFTKIGLFRNLSPYLQSLKSKMYPGAVNIGVASNGAFSNVAWGLAPFVLTYNKNVLKEAGLPTTPPTTMAQLVAESEQIGVAGKGKYNGYCQDSGNDEQNGQWSVIYWVTEGGSLETASGSAPTVNTPQDIKIATAYQKWYDAPGAWAQGITVRQCRELFADNKVAFNFESSWATGIYETESKIGKAFDSQWGFAPIPAGPNGHPGVSFDASQGLAVATYSKFPTVDAAFITFMVSNPTITTLYLNDVGFPSPIVSLASLPAYKTPAVKTLLTAMKADYEFKSVEYDSNMTSLGTAMQKILANGANVTQTLNQLQQNWKKTW